MKPKNSNFQSLHISEYNCYFSEICQVSHGVLHQKKELSAIEQPNCYVVHENNEILIITRGGNKFHLPMDQQVTRILSLSEGILIQFLSKHEPRISQILYLQKNKNMMDVEDTLEEKYCYATLNRHPLNPIKILGQLKNEEIIPWIRTNQKLTCIKNNIPFAVSYNVGLSRNAFHVFLANIQQIKRQQQFAFLPTHTYSLKTLTDVGQSEIITQVIFEQNCNAQEILQVQLNKSIKPGFLIVFARTHSDVRIFQVNIYAASNSTKLLTIISSALAIRGAKLYSQQFILPQLYNKAKKDLSMNFFLSECENLSDITAILTNAGSINYYYGGNIIHSGKLILSNQIAEDKMKKNFVTQLIKNPFQILILRVLQNSLGNDFHIFLQILKKVLQKQNLKVILPAFMAKNQKILQIIHHLYEEMKLFEMFTQQRRQIAQIITKSCLQQGKLEYLDYYSRQGHYRQFENTKQSSKPANQLFNIFWQLQRILYGQIPKLSSCVLLKRSQFILSFFQILVFGDIAQIPESFMNHLIYSKYEQGKQHFYKTLYPLLSQKAFHLEYFTNARKQFPHNNESYTKDQKAFLYLVYNNLSSNQILTYPLSIRAVFYWILRQMRRNLPSTLYEIIPKLGFYLINRQDLYKNIKLYKRQTKKIPFHLSQPSFDEHIKTLVHTSTSHQYLLTSNASQMNKINNDLIFQQVHRLLSSISQIRIKAKDIDSIPEQQWEKESQNILQKFSNRRLSVLIGQGAFTLGNSRSFITDIIKIPKINLNGVLPNDIKIALDLKDDKQSLIFWPQFHSGMVAGLKLSRHVIPLSQDHLKTWIFYQKPDTPRRDHSGFLLSLGLLGYLKCFSPTDIYQYLKPNNQFTSVAILLGVSASNISKSDESLSKTLILHIPVLLPPTVDVEIPINVQTSALIGVGLLHKGTCNRTMTQMILSQIGKKPSTDKCLDREGYSLAAGWALGMICLGVGDKKQSFRDLQLQQRLIRFIEGGKKMDAPHSMISTNFINENKCSSIKQGPNVNLHITAPAALLAISLMYLKSNNSDLANRISIPNSFNTIQECNPNHILLKAVAKNLIMWNQIGNTKQFILSQVPELIRFIYENSLSKVYQRYYLVYNVSEIDYQTITTIYASVMTGAVLSMALKYAGTGNRTAMESIKWHIQNIKSIKIVKCQFANDPLNKNCIDQYELFSLLCTSILALSIVMAGSCDIQCLKIVRIIRKKFQDAKVFHYGFSMAINMAIGFIFLGYGNCTFNRQDMSVAALLISVYPQFPNSPTDNKWHLQALRHFYVLGLQEKIFHAVDVDTNKVVNVNAEMQFFIDGKTVIQQLHTPILLQQSKKLIKVKIKDQDYFDVDFSFNQHKPDPKAIYIKRKHFRDIDRNLLNPENPMSTEIMKNRIQQTLKEQIRYTSLLPKQTSINYLNYLIPNTKKTNLIKVQRNLQINRIEGLYFDMLKEDKLQLLQIYLTLNQQAQGFPHSKTSSLIIDNINLILSFEKWQGKCGYIELVRDFINNNFKELINDREFKNYLLFPLQQKKQYQPDFYQKIKLAKLPSAQNLQLIKEAIYKLKSKGQVPSTVEMFMYLMYPQCPFNVLTKVIQKNFE